MVATNPMEMVKINTQMAGQYALKTGTKPKTSMEIVKELGVRGLYRGTAATLLRYVALIIHKKFTRRFIFLLLL